MAIVSREPPWRDRERTSSMDPYRLPLSVLVIGLLSIAMLIGTDRLRHRSIVRDNAYVKAVAEIQRDVAISHLWLEEHVTGDQVDVLEISTRLDRSLHSVGLMLGSAPPAKASSLVPLERPLLIQQAEALEHEISEFRRLSDLRQRGFEGSLDVGIGSPLDIRYDAVFARVLSRAQALSTSLEDRMVRNRDRSRLLFVSILMGWAALIAVAAVGLFNRERHRRQAEQALRDSEAQLLQAQKLEAVGRVAGGLAHDINNYLAAIRGHCELVRRKLPAEHRVAQKMDAVVRTVLKASSLIDRLLAFSQKQPVKLAVVNLNRVVAGLEKMLRPSLGETISVEKRFTEDLWNVEIDLSQLEQVVVNLLINARDAMPEGGEIVLTTENIRLPRTGGALPSETAAGIGSEQVMLAVADNGIGIAAEVLDKIYDPFWTTKDKSSHSGMGLATVYGIVGQSGGRIHVTSEVGRGTTFHIYLPRSSEPETFEESPSPAEQVELEGSESILLVDDNTEFREATEALLSALGYRVLVAAGGDEALAVFSSQNHEASRIDLVLTDVVMPGLSGIELVERLRQEQAVRAIYMSSYTEDVVNRYGLQPGDIHFMKKQFSSTSLARMVRESLDR